MAQSKQTANAAVEDIKQTEHPVSDRIKETLHDSVDALSEKAAATESSVREAAKTGSQNFNAKQKELEGKWNQSSARRYATENPVTTAGIAFAAGMLLSSFLNKK